MADLAPGTYEGSVIEMGIRGYFSIPAAGALYFFSAWLLMIFAGIVADDVGIRPFGYLTALIATIGLWLVVAPLMATIARSSGK